MQTALPYSRRCCRPVRCVACVALLLLPTPRMMLWTLAMLVGVASAAGQTHQCGNSTSYCPTDMPCCDQQYS